MLTLVSKLGLPPNGSNHTVWTLYCGCDLVLYYNTYRGLTLAGQALHNGLNLAESCNVLDLPSQYGINMICRIAPLP